MRSDGIFGIEPRLIKNRTRKNLLDTSFADRRNCAIQKVEDRREATAANTIGRIVLDNIQLFQGMIRKYGVCPCIGKRRHRNFLHEVGVVFLDKIEQITEGLGSNLVSGKLFARIVAI